ncbi:plasmid IncI1-type surface exclusion protein ExcA [Pantoea dispersa]|uniref:plasmid IncI1-type surface exclusion protein ExcA n=1 Tax=Pantoea dispersa TaxID=59814 RepID=UPI001CA61930|nr:plasmid IncI1-type surface exclusion protein ExcA [Pantoea dispersa]QZY97787.1 plasmid IncI1-type surface exclusion protein ExcA [Pantoea dispersa]
MKTIDRHNNSKDILSALMRTLYYFIALPSLVFIAIALIIVYSGPVLGGIDSDFNIFAFVVFSAIIFPLGYRRFSITRRRRQLKKMVALLTSDERFSPLKQHQVMDAGRGKYLGIDIKSGNILYIHMVKKGVVDVIGLTMRDWKERELEDSTLRINTKNPEVPVLSVNAHPTVTKELFDTLGAMSHNSYPESFPQEPWPLHVSIQSRFVEFEHDVVVPQASN